jgi:hypothetical protein
MNIEEFYLKCYFLCWLYYNTKDKGLKNMCKKTLNKIKGYLDENKM